MTTKTELMHKIRENCLDCTGGSWLEVERCTSSSICKLYPYRLGKDPEGASPAKQAQGRKLYESRKVNA